MNYYVRILSGIPPIVFPEAAAVLRVESFL